MLLALVWYLLQQAMVNFGTVYGMPPLLAHLLANLLPAVTCRWPRGYISGSASELRSGYDRAATDRR